MEALLASMDGRLDAFLERGDASGVLADEALIEATQLLDATQQSTGGPSMRVVGAVAWLYWCRSLALPGAAGQEDRDLAVAFFEVVGLVDPEMVPAELRGEILPPDSPERLGAQAVAILHEVHETAEPAAIDEAIGLLRRATQAVPPDHVERTGWLYYLSSALRTRFAATGDITDLHAAVDAGREAVATARADDPDRAASLSVLGNALLVRFERLDTVPDLHDAVTAQQDAVAAAPADGPGRVGYLSNLGAALHTRFQRLARPADLNGAIAANQAAVDATLADDPGRAGRLSNLSLGLRTRFEYEDDVADIDAAIVLGRAAVDAAPHGHPGRTGFMANLGASLLFRYRRIGRLADLDAGIATTRAAIDATPDHHPNRPGFLSNLGDMLRVRFERLSDMADLDAAVTALEEAVATTPDGHASTAPRRSNLAIALSVRFGQVGARTDIDAAITEGRKAVAGTPADHAERAMYLSSLGLALLARFEHFGDVADINEGVSSARESVALTPAGHPDRPGYLSDLAGALDTRFGRIGDVADLDAAVDAAREAVTTGLADHPRMPVFQHNLSSALHTRYERDGELADLDAAVTASRAAVAAAVESSERGRFLSLLGAVLLSRFHRHQDMAKLDAAIAAGRESVDVTPADFPDRALYLSMYGLALHARFSVLDNQADLDAAITAGGAAVAATPADHPDRAIYLSNYGSALRTRFTRLDRQADLDAAIAANQEAAALIPVDHPYRARFLYTYGLGLRSRFDKVANLDDARTALRTFREATSVAAAPTSVRMEAARARGALAAELGWWPDAADGYTEAVELLPFLAWRGAGQRSREQLLTDWGGLAADGAACAVAAGQLDRAITMLEQGRGVLWSQLLETRSDLTALHRAHPDLAARLDSLRTELDRPTPAGSPSTRDTDARIAAARQWQALIDQVRAQPGFHDFARPPQAAQLRGAAAVGTIVVVNISRWRCDALLVTGTGIEVKPLTGLTQEATVDKVNAYLDALQLAQTHHSSDMEQAISGTLEWLWDGIAEPVLDMLGHHRTPAADQEWPRVWWCPTGPLAVVPLHAAGHHQQEGRSVLDRVVSSYTPTLRALSAARSRQAPAIPERLLLVAVPDTPGAQPLPNVNRERELLTSLFDDERYTVLAGPDATRANILREFASHTWAHASCHGDQNMADPTAGGLVPYDWQTAGLVNVLDLTSTDHAGGEFVFLSACKSATGGIAVLDEAISLAAALHYTGWRHVIATLWSVGDNSAADITVGTYNRLLRAGTVDPAHAAEALHHALREYRQRDNHRRQPSRWAQFSHTGP